MGDEQQIRRTMAGAATVLEPTTSLTEGRHAALLTVFKDLIAEADRPDVVVDCACVTYVDSDALEMFVRLHREAEALGGRLSLINLNDVVTDILTVTRLGHVLNISNDLGSALRRRKRS